MGPFEKIKGFYRDIVGLPIPATPTDLTPGQVASAVEHWEEEIREFRDAKTIEDRIDAALDLGWLAFGRVIEMGADLPAHFAEVARANGDRVPGRNPKRPQSTGFDAVKPEGWRGPDHSAVIQRRYTMPPQPSEMEQIEALLEWITSAEPVGNSYAFDFHGRRHCITHPGKTYEALCASRFAEVEAGQSDAGQATVIEGEFTGVEPSPLKIILVGHGRHGKDTAAEMLRDQHGLRFMSSSLFCAEKVMLPAFEKALGFQPYKNAEDCFDDRHATNGNDRGARWVMGVGRDNRRFWFNSIRDYCTPDKARLAREIFADHDMYVGIRDRRELWAAQLIPNVLTVWVDASGRLPPEDGGSMNIEPWMADVVLDNNGTLEDLSASVANLMLQVKA